MNPIASRRPLGRARAFSLLEMTFVISMLAGVLGLIYFIFHNQSATADKLEDQQEALRSGLFALEILTRDLRQLVTVDVVRDASGVAQRKYGDHLTPVKISPLGTQISFYIPAPGGLASPPALAAQTLTYTRVPTKLPGVYAIRRTVGTAPQESDIATAARSFGNESPDRLLPEMRVKDLRFQLLEPDCKDAARRSPDAGFYLRIALTGVDRKGRIARLLPNLVRLDYPSERINMGSRVAEMSYQAASPLTTPPDTFIVSPEEAQLVSNLKTLSQQFAQGRMGSKDFAQAVQQAMATVADAPTTVLMGGTGPRIPTFSDLSVRPSLPGDTSINLMDTSGNALSLVTQLEQMVLHGQPAPSTTGGPAGATPASSWWINTSNAPNAGTETVSLDGEDKNPFGPQAGSPDNPVLPNVSNVTASLP